MVTLTHPFADVVVLSWLSPLQTATATMAASTRPTIRYTIRLPRADSDSAPWIWSPPRLVLLYGMTAPFHDRPIVEAASLAACQRHQRMRRCYRLRYGSRDGARLPRYGGDSRSEER